MVLPVFVRKCTEKFVAVAKVNDIVAILLCAIRIKIRFTNCEYVL